MSSNIKEFHEKISSRKEYWIPLLFYTFAAYGFSMLNRTVGADDLATPLYVNDTVWLRELRWGAVLWKKLFSFGDCVPYLDKFLNVRVIVSYGLLFLTLAINQVALRYVPLSVMPCITATSFVWVFVMGALILKEKVSPRKALGVAIIIAGVVISRL